MKLIFERHLLWSKLESRLSKGGPYPFEPLDKDKAREDVIKAIDFGNHKEVDFNKELSTSMTNEEICRGWVIIVQRLNVQTLFPRMTVNIPKQT